MRPVSNFLIMQLSNSRDFYTINSEGKFTLPKLPLILAIKCRFVYNVTGILNFVNEKAFTQI